MLNEYKESRRQSIQKSHSFGISLRQVWRLSSLLFAEFASFLDS